MLPTTANFTTRTLGAFMGSPVGYEVVFYHTYRKILPGYWAIMDANVQGEMTAYTVRTDAQMADMAKEYREREGE